MQIPETLKIGAQKVEIIQQEWSVDRMGASHMPPNKIYINSTLCELQQRSTLLHEIFEYVNDACDLQLNHTQISALETMLFQVLHDNKLMF